MLLTATTLALFLVVGVAAVALGHFTSRHALYIFGVILIFFMGLFTIQNGVAETVGLNVTLNETVLGNETVSTSSTVYVYDAEGDMFTNGIGLLCVVIAAGLALTWWQGRQKEKEAKKQSVELDD